MTEDVRQLAELFTGYGWIAASVLFVLVVIGLAHFADAVRKLHSFGNDLLAHLKGKRMSDSELKKEASEVAREMMEFVQLRQGSEPEFSFESFQALTQDLIRHSQETQNLYYRDFSGRVSKLLDEFLKRKLQNKELDSFYEHPTNYIGLRIVAMQLASLAEKVRAK